MQIHDQHEQQPGRRPRFISRQGLRTEKGVSFSDATLYRKINSGSFPRPVKLGDNTNGWAEAEIDAWASARIVARDSVNGAN